MSFLTLWLLVLILESSIANKHRSVNLAMETVLQFDKENDINVINKIQNFLSQIQVLLNKKREESNNVSIRRNNNYRFTDFVEDMISTIKSFEDNTLMEVFRIIDIDFQTRTFKNDLLDDNAKRFLSRKLTVIRNQTAFNIRNDLDTALRTLRANKNEQSSYILDFVNTLYKKKSERKLLKLIKKLNLFQSNATKSKDVLKSIIKKVLNDVIYQHYNNLEDNEKGYIKKFLRTYLTDNMPTSKKSKIKQLTELTTATQDNINTEEKTYDRKPTKQFTSFELTPETFEDIHRVTTKKFFTHITLYPNTVTFDKKHKFRTGFPTTNIIENEHEENTKDERDGGDVIDINKIFANQSLDINVNLMLTQNRGTQDSKDSIKVKSFRTKSTPYKFLRASKKKLKRNKKHFKSSIPALSIETFGSLYKTKIPKKQNKKNISKLGTYGKTTLKNKYSKSSYVYDIKETNLPEKNYVLDNHRRLNKPKRLKESKGTEFVRRDVGMTKTRHSLTTRAYVSHILLTDKVKIPVITANKSTTKTTLKDALNEIIDNKKVTELKIFSTVTPLLERITTISEFVPKKNNTQYENNSNTGINNLTTVTVLSPTSFDVDNFIKKSEVLNFDDEKKNKQLEEKMRADFGSLFDSPTTNATTEGFTDIFKELEDAYNI